MTELLAVTEIFAALTGAITTVGWSLAVVTLGEWKRLHHYWIGLAIALLPLALFGGPTWWAVGFWALGLWIMADDAWQHIKQLRIPGYRSPLNRWYHAARQRWGWFARLTTAIWRVFARLGVE